ncbi:Putative phosphatase [Thioalkalivibrio nitratireducens DSM 14787]|uniref:Phosphatase n=1 Tax=Thioalkalivibrio nitratireducens (strain DSM 14787 / UNIQEM 213 / ALEN2) TaxID=1255043 RepID=L0E1G7_THIND|nr:PhoX family phosphatase [Thioalkalivibrio nitratireducens]AGA35143.1 Putative phosphatase [Thioalkalivibrio nitratireducens DSM 14787]
MSRNLVRGQPIDHGDGDEPMSNPSQAPHFQQILTARMNRRTVLKGSLSAAIAGLFGSAALQGCGSGSSSGAGRESPMLLGFEAIPVSEDDTVHVAPGYSTQVLAEWGRSVSNPGILYDLPLTGAQQGDAIGSHHDGMHFFPIEATDPYEGSSTDGLLVMNHEYVEPRYMHASAIGQELTRSQVPTYMDGGSVRRVADEVLTEMNGHGVSVLRVQKQVNGTWAVVADARNRRVTALTPMEIRGPVRGTDFVRTKFSPDGTMTRGTINNCAHGVTPWNTYLTCEENWAGYFRNRDNSGDDQPREHQRYGVRAGISRYGWELADADPASNQEAYARFNAAPLAASASDDYRNEPNAFGWVVEIDPFGPSSVPIKRTHLGRFAHEGVVFQPAVEGQPVVLYSGDDARNEYIYKFVSAQPYHRATAGGHLLDSGTLYVARFHEDGTGEWLPLIWGQGLLVPQPINQGEDPDCTCFHSQADVLVNTRLAADRVGATPMDRPEWGAVDPNSGEVYFTLTNNTSRSEGQTDSANPRGPNPHGHIIRWREDDNNPAATTFTWDIFAMAGDASGDPISGGVDGAGNPLTGDNIFSSPDGLWIDPDSRIWIQMDMSESVMNVSPVYAMMGNNGMLAANPFTGEIRRFLTGSLGQEITGVISTSDQRTLFINQQHPGATVSAADFASGDIAGKGNWPLGGNHYGRSATVVITKDDGGVIGT